MPQVLTIVPAFPLTQELEMDNFIADFGDGHELRVNFNQAWTRADGQGGVTSYKGQNFFGLKLNVMDAATTAAALWAFYQARKGALESFYVYNVPYERAAIDATGSDPTGRYLVRFDQDRLSREQFTRLIYSASIRLKEVRS